MRVRKAKRLVKQVKAVQELLGEHQDSVVARGLLRELRHLDLDGDSSSPRRARLFVDDASRQWGLGALGVDAVLVASELVGNAVAHARTSCRLDLRLDGLGLTIAVHDYDYRGLLLPLACYFVIAVLVYRVSLILPASAIVRTRLG